ncbi:MotE family protein [Rhizobium sp. CG5]|uniref:MotE family protein n=1 Tax=Rhizobium sp. CG5 TaxID=2726076 RepID=UPI002033A1C1|nr:MotE family protein [Rhizobium sp. CG5]MCM2472812.1 MotE family protein [Rhizobium sp. CG5]
MIAHRRAPKSGHRVRLAFAAGALLLASVASGHAQEKSPLESITQDEIQKYCTSIADPARDQRYLLQKQDLEKLQADVDSRIAVLEARKVEYEDWLKRRNDFLVQAEAGLVEIYKKMKADAAAPQLEEVNVGLAAAILMKLPARQSSLILSEMDAGKAGAVASIMSSAADPTTSKDPS